MILDLFAGPGGWSEGLRLLGVADQEVGIEWDAAACQTRQAAGHLSIRADVSQYPTEPFAGKVTGLIASPPCTAFSTAGKGAGVELIEELVGHIADQRWKAMRDHPPTVWLPLEVGRWVEALRPEWIACEQVPPALPLWRAYLPWLRSLGYSVWAGVLNAANYGVPQTRKRAFLMASRVKSVSPPEPTHARNPGNELFDTKQKWVSMAEALGWGATDVPMPTVTGGGTATGGPEPIARGGRALLEAQKRGGGAWLERAATPQDEFDPMSQPSRTLTGKTNSWSVDGIEG